jgi:hypothetical protein
MDQSLGHPDIRHRHLRRPLHLIPRVAGILAALVVVVVLVGCGSSGAADPSAACASAHAALPQAVPGATRDGLAVTANGAAGVLNTLARSLGSLPSNTPNPEALANLRNAAGVAAISFREVASLLTQPGSGLLGPLRNQGHAAYAQIQQAGTILGALACTSRGLGGGLFDVLAMRVAAPAGPNLAVAAQTACTDITSAYGTTQIAVDPRAAATQLERSTAVLRAARNDLADVTGPTGAHLRTALAQAINILVSTTGRINHGANPARTSLTAFIHTRAVLAGGFRAAGITCSIPGP